MDELKAKIDAALADFWDEQVIAVDVCPTDVGGLVAAMDSMSALEVLIILDEIVGKELSSDAVIRKGGYDTREQFIKELGSKALAEAMKGAV
jgi:hypothetical protein